MSPTARNQDCKEYQGNVFWTQIVRTQKLEASELQALYGEERDAGTCSPVDEEQQTEEDKNLSDECKSGDGVCESMYFGDLSSHSHRPLAHTHLHNEIFFSNKMYYSKLEELKREHLKNIAELQRLYLQQLSSEQTDGQLDIYQANSKQVAQKLNSSDQSDDSEEECVSEQEDQPEWDTQIQQVYKSFKQQSNLTPLADPSLERKWCPSLISSLPSSGNQQQRQVERVQPQRRGSNVTIPQPFQMTLREEERKLRKVKTRSEVELENECLKKELEELRECGRKFRATPAPASTHLPFNDVINMHQRQRQPAKEPKEAQDYHGNHKFQEKLSGHHQDNSSQGNRFQDRTFSGHLVQGKPSPRQCFQDNQTQRRRLQEHPTLKQFQGKPSPRQPLQGSHRSIPPLPQQPFSFIERERKKKEKKILEQLNNLSPREEHRVFKARPVPKSLYHPPSQDYQLYGAVSLQSRMQEHRPHSTTPPADLEESLQEEEMSENEEIEGGELTQPQKSWEERKQGTKKVEKRRNVERDRGWSYIHPLRRASFSRSQEVLPVSKSEYISV